MGSSELQPIICFGIPACVILIIIGVGLRRSSKANACLKNGDREFLLGAYESAESHYSQALQTRASRASCHLRLGLLAFVQKDFSKAVAAFAAAIDSNTGLMIQHVEKVCSQLNLTPDQPLYECFRKAEFLSLNHQFEGLDKDLKAKQTPSIHLWGESEAPNPSDYGSKQFIALGTENSKTRIARPVVEIEPEGSVRGEVEPETAGEGVKIKIRIFHKVAKIHSNPADHVVTLAPGDSQFLTDAALMALMNRWKVNEDPEILSEIENDINRALIIINTFCQNRKLGEEISELTFDLQRRMPVFWHEAVSRQETLTGTTWIYTPHQWKHWVTIKTVITLDRATWRKGAYGFSKETRRKLAECSSVSIVNEFHSW